MGKKKKSENKNRVHELNKRARESGLTLDNNFGAADTAKSEEKVNPKGWTSVEGGIEGTSLEVLKEEPANVPTEPVVPPVETAPAVVELAKPEELAKTEVAPTKTERFPNRVRKSIIQSPTKTVWVIADALMESDPATRRKDIMNACLAQGIAFYTARTQIQQWFAARQASRLQAANAASPIVKVS